MNNHTLFFDRKPIIGAVNGYAMGGGSEMVVNLDYVVAGTSATFGFPEVKRGVTIGAGGVPRLVRIVGHQKGAPAAQRRPGSLKLNSCKLCTAVELVLTGRNIPAKEAQSLGFINDIVVDDEVEARALQVAREIASHSPDSVKVLLQAVRMSNETGSLGQAFAANKQSAEWDALWGGENLAEG